MFLLTHLQRAGGRPVIVIGGGTGMIGDPSGKSSERNLLDDATIAANSAALRAQLERFLDFSPGPTQPRMVNNRDWLAPMSVLDFLRDIGKHFTVPYMLAKDSVQARLGAGMSFTEFSYKTLQAADFLHLHRDARASTSRWAAPTSGATSPPASSSSAASRARGGRGRAASRASGCAARCCSPAPGQKMGKSERGAVFLDRSLTSPYEFYQYWLNDDDALVVDHLRWLTLLDGATRSRRSRPSTPRDRRRGRRSSALAHDLTARIHGPEEAERQARHRGGGLRRVRRRPGGARDAATTRSEASSSAPRPTAGRCSTSRSRPRAASRGDARRLIDQGGLSVNGERVSDPAAQPPPPIAGRYWWVALGKKRRVVGRRRRSGLTSDSGTDRRERQPSIGARPRRPRRIEGTACSGISSSEHGRGTSRPSRSWRASRSTGSTSWLDSSFGTATAPRMPRRRRSSPPGVTWRGCAIPTGSMPGCDASWSARAIARLAGPGARIRAEAQVRPIESHLSEQESVAADRDQLARGFSALSPEQRTLIVLHYYLGLPVHETALALGLPEGTVKSRLSRTTRQMRATLDADARLPLTQRDRGGRHDVDRRPRSPAHRLARGGSRHASSGRPAPAGHRSGCPHAPATRLGHERKGGSRWRPAHSSERSRAPSSCSPWSGC